jgi:hypothetical protein
MRVLLSIVFAIVAASRALAIEPLSAFDPTVWVRTMPSDLQDAEFLRWVLIPGVDVALIGVGIAPDGVRRFVAMRFFSGEQARWKPSDPEPEWVTRAREIPPDGVGGDLSRNQTIVVDGRRITFFYTDWDANTPDAETSAGLRRRYGGMDLPDICKDPAANWIESRIRDRVERKVIVYLFDPPASPPGGGPCYAPDDQQSPFVPPYDRIRVVVPLLKAIVLQDNSLLVIGPRDSFVGLPAVFRLQPDLRSPAIDGKRLFLVDKTAVDAARTAALEEFQRRDKRGEYINIYNRIAPLAALVEQRVIALLKRN